MKILHTADWHIGQNFFGYDRKDEHLYFFNWLRNTIKDLSIDVLLIAGDVFDSPNPSAESQKIYYRFLKEVTRENKNLKIVIIAGNHDSSARLEAPNPLLEEMNIHVVGQVKKTQEGEIDVRKMFIPLTIDHKIVAWCIAVPYLRQGDYPSSESYTQGVVTMYSYLYDEIQKIKQKEQPIIFMGHLQATGSEISDHDRSERTIVGGLESISPEVFDKKDILYTALGHLHKAQRVSKRENVRYSGSPLPMSFSEKYYKQGINLVEINGDKSIQIERIDFEPLVKLLSLPKEPEPLHEVLEQISKLEDGEITNTSPFLELKVLLSEPEPSMRKQIEEALKNKAVRLAIATPYKQRKEHELKSEITYEQFKALSPIEIAEDIFMNQYGNEMSDNLKTLLHKVIHEIDQ